jgi:hypothetical protein
MPPMETGRRMSNWPIWTVIAIYYVAGFNRLFNWLGGNDIEVEIED